MVPDGFLLKEGLSSKIRPGARDTFTIEMTTQQLGLKSGVLRFTSNDPNENPYEFTIQGEVLEAVLGRSNAPEIRIYCQSNNQNVPDGARYPSAVQRRRRDFSSTTTAKATSTWVTSTCRQAPVTACQA